jgi:hypothetical protein
MFRNNLIFNYSRASSSVRPVLAPLYRNHLSDVAIVMPLVSFTFNVTMLFLIYYFQTTSWTSNYNLRTPPHMYTRQQAMNVACYRVRTSVFVAAYQQAPSSEVPFIVNLKQSRGLIVPVPIRADRPTINTCHLSVLELKNGRRFLQNAAGP